MCGIVGALAQTPIDAEAIVRMRDTLVHRGPDHGGVWISDDRLACFGHRRLAIIDLDPEANQPLRSRDGRFVITYNGEIYNYRTLRAEMEALGTVFSTRSDTEVLLEAYRRWGPACLERLSGMWAFAIWDVVERRLFCARDRAGEKPFYYAEVGGAFVFASELKAIVEWPSFRRNLSYPALIDYLTYGFVPDPKCIWEGCRKLSPGHCMTVTCPPAGPVRVEEPVQYWNFEFDPDETVSDWGSRIRGTLQAASAEMSVSDVPIGTFLSGGVDSSSVTAALKRAGIQPHSFTIGFDEEGFDERRWAREVAELCGTRHTERAVAREDVGAVFDQLLFHYDEPFNDYSYLPTYYLCREAKRSITVALSGDGGDEVFAGYRKYQRLAARDDLRRYLPRSLAPALAATAAQVLPRSSRIRRTVDQYRGSETSALADMLTLGFTSPTLGAAARGPLAVTLGDYDPRQVVLDHVRKAPPGEVGLINAMRYLDLKLTLAGDILVKVDRASMAVALEVRPVYLHHDVMRLAARIPPRLLAGKRQAKRVLKKALEPWLPHDVLYRRKMGFHMPLGRWIARGGTTALPAGAGSGALDELLEPDLLDRLTRQQQASTRDNTAQIHSLVLLERWLDRWSQ